MKPKRPSIAIDRSDVTDFLRQSPRPGPEQEKPFDVKPEDGMTSNRQSVKTPDKADDRVKLTVYVDAADLEALEDERRRRLRAGERRRGSDLSALIREAIRARYPK